MKLPLNHSVLVRTTVFVLLGSFIGTLTNAHAAGDRSFIRPKRPHTQSYHNELADGYLLVYSATEESRDGDLAFYAHSSYVIYGKDGKVIRNIENHMSGSDELPERVRLAPGSYTVEARSTSNGYVRAQVVINPGRQTVLNLD